MNEITDDKIFELYCKYEDTVDLHRNCMGCCQSFSEIQNHFTNGFKKCFELTNEKLTLAKYTMALIAQDPFNGRDGEPDPMKVILRMRVYALNALEKLK